MLIPLLLHSDAPPACAITSVVGCYADSAARRALNFTAAFDPAGRMSQEYCAHLCCQAGFPAPRSYFGVEFGAQCFCGRDWAGGAPAKLDDGKCDMPCTMQPPGVPTPQMCGGSDALLVFRAAGCPCGADPPPPAPPAPLPYPLYHGCLPGTAAAALPYCDTSLSHEHRANDLLDRLTLNETIAQLSPTAKPFCAIHTPALARVGLPRYKWLTEVNTLVNSPCLTPSRCPTTFVGPNGMAASFNRSSWTAKGDVVSTDMRVLNAHGVGEVGLTGYGPNINMLKDPRYGRNSELPGEDPHLSGEYGVAYTAGMQQRDPATGHYKMISYLKHYTAYSVEASRFTFTANVTLFDFWDSYLPQYEKALTEGEVPASGVMCSYFAANGVSSCGDSWLLNEVLRGTGDPARGGTGWNRTDAVVMSDCSAVGNMEKNGFASGPVDASAKAMNGGLDLYGGWNDDLWTQGYLYDAVQQGATSNGTVRLAAFRTLIHKLRLGLFDPVNSSATGAPTKWIALGRDATNLNSSWAQQVSYEAALQAPVLLKNDGAALPLRRGAKLAVLGPMGVEQAGLLSDYADNAAIPGCGVACMQTIGGAIAAANGPGGAALTAVHGGVAVDSSDDSGVAAALAAARGADAVVLVLGITKVQEHEGIDRKDTLLPGLQSAFAKQVLALKKPTVLVLSSGGCLSVDDLVAGSAAIVEAYNPAVMGPRALAALLFGDENRWGKLVRTIYPADYSDKLKIQDMSFPAAENGVGRSYRYYNATTPPLFTFGHGLSYTSFGLRCDAPTPRAATADAPAAFEATCTLSNTGARAGDEVLQVFHSAGAGIRSQADHPVPIRKLVDFERTTLAAAAHATVAFTIPHSRLALTTNTGERVVYNGTHTLTFTRGHGDAVVCECHIPATAACECK